MRHPLQQRLSHSPARKLVHHGRCLEVPQLQLALLRAYHQLVEVGVRVSKAAGGEACREAELSLHSGGISDVALVCCAAVYCVAAQLCATGPGVKMMMVLIGMCMREHVKP